VDVRFIWYSSEIELFETQRAIELTFVRESSLFRASLGHPAHAVFSLKELF
jgi:hypothetical protein